MKEIKNIDNKYRPIPFWSWNDKLSTDETVFQIEQMGKQGIGGFFMHARGGLQTEYMSEEWFDNVRASIDKCKEKGIPGLMMRMVGQVGLVLELFVVKVSIISRNTFVSKKETKIRRQPLQI